jgi:hypothetical protein
MMLKVQDALAFYKTTISQITSRTCINGSKRDVWMNDWKVQTNGGFALKQCIVSCSIFYGKEPDMRQEKIAPVPLGFFAIATVGTRRGGKALQAGSSCLFNHKDTLRLQRKLAALLWLLNRMLFSVPRGPSKGYRWI